MQLYKDDIVDILNETVKNPDLASIHLTDEETNAFCCAMSRMALAGDLRETYHGDRVQYYYKNVRVFFNQKMVLG